MTDATSTPASWRAGALGLLVGGLVAGERAAASRVGGLAVAGGAALTGLAAVRVARAASRPPLPPGPPPLPGAPERPTFSVVIAARDEARVVARLIRDLGEQTHRDEAGEPCFEVVVVDDRSTDGTADAAHEAAEAAGLAAVTRVVRREGPNLADGKGAALTAAQPADCRGDVVVVLDADARVGPAFLATLAAYVRAGARALTARRRVLGADRSTIAQAQADEQTLDGLLQRGRWALGGCSEFRGNGIVVERALLEAVGGWRAEALTEDLDLSSRVAAASGVTVAWAIDAEVSEEPVQDWPSLWRQRVRWAEGAIRRVFEHGPRVLASDRLSLAARADFAAYVGQLVAPPLVLGTALGAIRRRRFAPVAVLVATYASIGGLLGWRALAWEQAAADGSPLPTAERAPRAARLAIFNAVWLGAVPAALWRLATRRGAVRYDKMEHG